MGITTNLALNKPATSSTYVKPYFAANAVNGTLTPVSRWLCNTLPGWVCVDLGAFYWVNRWVVRHMSVAGWKSPDYNMTDFVFQGSSDNVKWNNLDSVSGNLAAITDRTITPVCVRYVRVYVTKGLKCNPQLASLMEFEVYPAPSSQFLTGITLSSGILSPQPFAGRSIFAYTASVGNDVAGITLTPAAEDVNATIRVNGTVVKNNTASTPITLNVGANAISVQVIGSDGSAQATYTVTVTRAASQNADLNDLRLNGATVSGFDSRNITYNVNVDNSIANAVLIPFVSDSTATVKVNGVQIASGQTSAPIALTAGAATSIPVVVTAQDGTTTKTYTVNVTRQASNPYLSSLTLAGNVRGSISLNVPFDGRNTFAYSAVADYDDNSVAMTFTKEDTNCTVTVSGSAATLSGNVVTVPISAVGDYPVTITVAAADGSSKAYAVTVVKPSSNYLSGTITIAYPPASPATINVARGTTTYTVSNINANFKIKASLEDSAATMTISCPGLTGANPAALGNNAWSALINKAAGSTVRATLTITSKNGGAVKNYYINISMT